MNDDSIEILRRLRRAKLLLATDELADAKENMKKANFLYESKTVACWGDEIESQISDEFENTRMAFLVFYENKTTTITITPKKSRAGRIWLACIGTFFLSLFLSWLGLVIGVLWICWACSERKQKEVVK